MQNAFLLICPQFRTVEQRRRTSFGCSAPPTPKAHNMNPNVIPSPLSTATMQSPSQLKKEIATLEAEILRLERDLLSLYRTAFEERLPTISSVSTHHSQYQRASPFDINAVEYPSYLNYTPPCSARLHTTSTRDQKNADSGRRTLAYHLAASCFLKELNTPELLSQDIMRCISSIYYKLANHPTHTHLGVSTSPTSSLSSSSIFSSHNRSDIWSPSCNEDATVNHQPQGLKQESGPYDEMVKVMKLCFDNDSFNYAAVMLKKFRLLVRSLEKVDPRKMKREQKLAFWINIHNALVMHAYLAYGSHDHVKSASILKAAYNVGGHCINACIIHNSIFGIHSHYSEPWIQTLFSPGRKFKTECIRHVYALEYPEPLVHFALCSGAYSDPAVRIYTAKNVFEELKNAKQEFVQASVRIHKGAKILLPKIVCYYAKDKSIDSSNEIMEEICSCLTEAQQKAIRKSIKGKPERCIHWVPQSSTFRYVIHAQLANGRPIS